MRRLLALLAVPALAASAQQPFTLQQVLSAPFATSLTAAPSGPLFAWVEDAEGRRNLWIGGPNRPARALTHNTEDDAQDIADLAWSPDASTIAYVYGAEIGNSGRPANPAHLQRPTPVEIYLQPTAGGDPVRLGEGHSPLFTRDGNSVLFIRAGQIFIACFKHCPPVPERSTEEVSAACVKNCHPERSEGSASLSAHPLLFDRGTPSQLTLSPDGTKLAYISRRRTHSFLALFELKTQTLSFPAPSTGNDSAPSFSPDGKYLAWLRFPFTSAGEFAGNRTSANPWSIQIADLATGTTRTLFTPGVNQPGSAEPRMSTGEPRLFFAAGNKVLFFSEADGWVHLYSIDSAISAPPILLTSGKSEVEDATISADGKSLLYATSAPDGYAYAGPSGGFREPNFLELPGADRRHILQIRFEHLSEKTKSISFGDGIETHPMLAGDGTAIAALVSDARTPMHPALVDHDHSAPKPLHPAALPKDYPAAALVTPQQVLFPSSDKLFQLHGQLFLPKQEADSSAALRNDKGTLRNDKGVALRNGNDKGVVRKHPAILFFHGGPKRQMLLGYPAMGYYSNAYAMNQYLASRGYIVLSVNYRGGIGYGLDFRQCQHCGADGAAEYADALGAAAYLRSRPDVDTAHIGIWGGSYGGYFVALALARNSDIFAAGVDFHGVHEWAREDNAAADWLRGPLAEQERIAALAHASSPMADVAKWRSPVLLIHGDDDPDVAYTQTPMLADALRARGVHVEELIFPDELHGFLLHKDWLTAYQAASDFFDRTLKPTGSKRKIPD